jgi:hypothetical protein
MNVKGSPSWRVEISVMGKVIGENEGGMKRIKYCISMYENRIMKPIKII